MSSTHNNIYKKGEKVYTKLGAAPKPLEKWKVKRKEKKEQQSQTMIPERM
jgi:hypothetical protein